MLSRTKVRIGIGSAAALALAAGALTTAYASPWRHGNNSSVSNTAFSARWSPQIATGTTTLKTVSSTVPSNGDVNPYGVAVVPRSVGHLMAGDVLVSNYNNKANLNGTGSSIVEVDPRTGRQTLFAWLTPNRLPSTCPGGIGLTTALVVLKNGWVVVGSLPTTDGTYKTAKSGCLIVLNSLGHAKAVITGHGINGPWGMSAWEHGDDVQLFVSNVLNGVNGRVGQQVNKGTVVRLKLDVTQQRFRVDTAVIVGSGFPEMVSQDGFVQGPTGVTLVGNTLFVADTLANRIAQINWATTRHNSAGLGFTLAEAGLLKMPLGLTSFGGLLLTVNGENGNLIAISLRGQVALVKALDTTAVAGSMPGAGALFGLAPSWDGKWLYYVNDLQNNLSATGPLRGGGKGSYWGGYNYGG
ncbi:hypothetical protein KGA66_16995 [Actinocrinis puniceicyclus]|uniref:NHL repeat containing protein n=1 Tax=Actinocrinis puniceicyclus TaxID=977794 RepID=A0A8J7WNW8_9ACTN|nr:hypothetical protein [Actinocrinis puniceicyclus]MBS2964758.1 hypothetical protein [Actinocrinis puniceicyclus]